jgi:toxin ParE1/3/4
VKNLDDEAEYIARDDPAAAQLVVKRIQDAVHLLSDNPALGHPGRIHNTRELIVPNTHYVIPYRVSTELKRIEILRVFHSSRKLPGRW